MLHAFDTDDFLHAVDAFDHHARQGQAQVLGKSCGKGEWPAASVRSCAELGSPAAALAVCRDLWALGHAGAGSLVAVFDGPVIEDEAQFDALLWRQLQTMHGVDAACFDWREGRPAEAAPRSFSIGGRRWRCQGEMPSAPGQRPRLIFHAQGA